MRQVSEVKSDMFDRAGNLNGIMSECLSYYSKSQYFGKLKAYLFINAFFLGIAILVVTVFSLMQGETEAGFGALILLVPLLVIAYMIWHSVEKKVKSGEKHVVFWSFFATGVLVFGKILMFMSIILIPLALMIGGEFEPEYKFVESGLFSGRYVLVRRKFNGQYEDNYGNIYED